MDRRRIIVLTMILCATLTSFTQDARRTEYVLGLTDQSETIAGLTIERIEPLEEGAVLTLGSTDAPVTIRLLEPTELTEIEQLVGQAEAANLLPGDHSGSGWNLQISALDINVGRTQTALLIPQINLYTVRLNRDALMEFSRRIEGTPSFFIEEQEGALTFDLRFRDILGWEEADQIFPGWEEISAELLRWAQDGLERDDQQVMGSILEIRILSPQEVVVEKRTVVTGQGVPEETWAQVGASVQVDSSNLLMFSGDGVSAGIDSILLEADAFVEFLRLGRQPEIAPISLLFGAGPFMDLNLDCLLNCEEAAIHQWLSYGIGVRAGYLRVSPNIVGDVVEDPLFAFGVELHGRVNLGTIIARSNDPASPITISEYYGTANVNAVFSPFYSTSHQTELLAGLQVRVLPDLNNGGFALYSLGVGIGARLPFDFAPLQREIREAEQ